jgi:hypothetical protein
MYVVDRDGLDGLFAASGEAAAITTASQVVGAGRPRAVSSSGLQALADATRHDVHPVEEGIDASWSELAPLALVATELPPRTAASVVRDTRVDPEREWVQTPPTRIGRHARPTVQPPLGARHGKERKRIVLSFVVGGAALTAAIILMALRPSSGPAAGPPEVAQVRRAESAGLESIAPHAPAGSGSADMRPVMGATLEPRALQRRPLTPPAAKLAGGRLVWRLPATFSLGGEAPDAVDDAAIAALASTLIERCQPGTLVVTGHTCNVGTAVLNLIIGKHRAEFALGLLVAGGLPAQGVRVISAAATHPEVSNATPAGRVRNRRVTIACQPQPLARARAAATQTRGER